MLFFIFLALPDVTRRYQTLPDVTRRYVCQRQCYLRLQALTEAGRKIAKTALERPPGWPIGRFLRNKRPFATICNYRGSEPSVLAVFCQFSLIRSGTDGTSWTGGTDFHLRYATARQACRAAGHFPFSLCKLSKSGRLRASYNGILPHLNVNSINKWKYFFGRRNEECGQDLQDGQDKILFSWGGGNPVHLVHPVKNVVTL